MSKCLAIKTGENTLEPTAQTNNTLNAIKLAVLQKQAMQNFAPNDEIWITESGDFTVPYDGIYEVTVINGGNGGSALPTQFHAVDGGASGAVKCELVRLNKDDIIPVTIGAGGKGLLDAHGTLGGTTSFGDISAVGNETRFTMVETATFAATSQYRSVSATGAGYGGGPGSGPNTNLTQTENNARNSAKGHLGGGGGACIYFSGEYAVGDGAQGSIRLRFFNPEKASLPAINDTDLIPYLTLLQRLDNLEKQFAENVVYNDKILITESGEWEAPVTGYYKVTCIGGGGGAMLEYNPTNDNQHITAATLTSGSSGAYSTGYVFLEKGEIVPVTIGAGGIGTVNQYTNPVPNTRIGGKTTFKSIYAWGGFQYSESDAFTEAVTFLQGSYQNGTMYGTVSAMECKGGGFGANYSHGDNSTQENSSGVFYGAGGNTRCTADGHKSAGNGAPGCVILYFHNPNKNQGV